MANLGSLSVFLTANTTPFQKGMFRAKKSMNSLSTGVKVASAAIAGSFAAIGASGLKLAIRAEEIESKFGVVFGAIPDMAEEAADKLSKKFDLADSSVQKMLGSTGDLLTGFGFAQGAALKLSARVAELAGDLASFQNIEGGAAEAAERLTKGILGETENLKSLGIVVRQDTKEFKSLVKQLVETNGLTEQQAKAQIILNKAFEQSKNAIGDYERTQDSAANSIKRLSEAWKEFRIGFGDVVKELILFTTGTGKDFATTLKDIGTELRNIAEQIKLLSKAGGLRNLLSIAGTGFSRPRQEAMALYDELDDILMARGITGGFRGLATMSQRGRETAIAQAIKAIPGVSRQGLELFKQMLPVTKEILKEARKDRKQREKDRKEALKPPTKAQAKQIYPIEDRSEGYRKAMADYFKKEDIAEAITGPALSSAIRAGSQEEAALVARTAFGGTEMKMRKKNVDANVATARELKLQNQKGVKVTGMKVVEKVL